MDGIHEEHAVVDAAVLSKDKKHDEQFPKVQASRWIYVLCHMMFFCLGICHYLPITFLSAANNFWLHKFRNVSDLDESASDRTSLQKDFASASMIASTVPSLMFGIFNVTYSNRFRITSRLIITLAIGVIIFVLLTISIKTNTDTVQVLFFCIVLFFYGAISGANTVNIVTSINLYRRFPLTFMNTALTGEGVAGVLGDVLNILSVSIFSDDITDATLMYFLFGTFAITITLLLFIVMSRTKFYNDCIDSIPLDRKKVPGIRELLQISYKIRFTLSLVFIFVSSYSLTHTAITSLVVSEQDSANSSWAKNYFSPVMTFLLSDVTMLAGRITALHLPFRPPRSWLLIISVIRTVILVPFIWLCNAQPRSHLPVLFPHDYQYGIVLGIFMLTSGYLINIQQMYLIEDTNKQDADKAFTLFGLGINIVQSITTPLSLVIVNIL